jgi:LysM repeat protein
MYLYTRHKNTHASISLKAVDPDVLDVKGTAHPAGVNAPPPTLDPNVLVTQTPTLASDTTSAAPPRVPPVAAADPKPKPAVASPPAPAPAAAPAPVLAAATFTSHTLADAKAKLDAGDLLAARDLLNDPLIAGHLTPADADAARHMLSEISQSVLFSKKAFKDDTYTTRYQVQNGERLSRIADKHSVTWELLCRINGLADARKVRAGQWIKIPHGPFNCVITKSAFRLDVYLGSPGETGSLFVTSFPVGLGKDNSTPTGTWMIQQGNKAHPATYYSPRGEGVIGPNDPKNPLGGYWMGLAGISGAAVDKNSYGIHGTIEPDSIGKQASMGCIRLGHEDIAFLYELLVDGKSKVIVKD